jgi:shikimate kinase
MIPQQIILVGPMGAGKTTLGTIIADRLGWTYYDNDDELARINNMTVEQLSSLSVDALHQLEGAYLADVVGRPAPFISGAAASVIDYPESQAILKSATSVYLRLPLQKVLERAGTSGIGRQALQENAEEIVRERYLRRDPIYSAVSRLTIDLGDSPETDAQKIIDGLGLQQ